jgi:hypothetical protein
MLGGRLQRRRGHDWLTEQADSGGRLHVNRSGSKRRHRRGCSDEDGDGDVTQSNVKRGR